jgi:hypothetical protein
MAIENEDKTTEIAADFDNASGETQYSLTFSNASGKPGSACVYQTDAYNNDPGRMSLAWLCEFSYPLTIVHFRWETNYSFVWGTTGQLRPGMIFGASQTWDADLSTGNQVSFGYRSDSYEFYDQTAGAPYGSLSIKQDGNIWSKDAAVGIGMSGSGAFVQQAESDTLLTFNPQPRYWIAFGDYTKGKVLDVEQISNPVEIYFPSGITSMRAVLNQDNTWTVSPD